MTSWYEFVTLFYLQGVLVLYFGNLIYTFPLFSLSQLFLFVNFLMVIFLASIFILFNHTMMHIIHILEFGIYYLILDFRYSV